MVLTGRAADAETAERWGLATRLVPEGEPLSRAVELGDRIAAFPPSTLLTDRSAVYDGGGTLLQQGLARDGTAHDPYGRRRSGPPGTPVARVAAAPASRTGSRNGRVLEASKRVRVSISPRRRKLDTAISNRIATVVGRDES